MPMQKFAAVAILLLSLFIPNAVSAQSETGSDIVLTVYGASEGRLSSSEQTQSGSGDSINWHDNNVVNQGAIYFTGTYRFDPDTFELTSCNTMLSGGGSGSTVDITYEGKATRDIDKPQQPRTMRNIQRWSAVVVDKNKKRCAPSSIAVDYNAGTYEIPVSILGFYPGDGELTGEAVNLSTDTFSESISNSTSDAGNMLASTPCGMAPIFAMVDPETQKKLRGTFKKGAKSFTASGNISYSAPQPTKESSNDQSDRKESYSGTMTLHYILTCRRQSDLEVIIEPDPSYANWIPMPGKNETDPNPRPLAFVATMRHKNKPDKPVVETAMFRFELENTTKEPGICMNSPVSESGAPYDLKILPNLNTDMAKTDSSGQWAESKVKQQSSSIIVSCFDGGAYGRLRVTAYTADGQSIVGHLKGDTNTQEVTIPKDKDGDRIADKWEQDMGVSELAAVDDTDSIPKGDGDPGDGFTLYEEYRGFIENNKFIRTNPKTKDLFVCNTLDGETVNGIKWMGAVTGIETHYKLTEEELGADRVINRNHSDTAAHVVDQHGVRIIQGANPTTSRAKGGPGTPKAIQHIEIATELDDWKAGSSTIINTTTNYVARITAHELLHCCNIFHHGSKDVRKVLWMSKEVEGSWRIYEYTKFRAAYASFYPDEAGEAVNVFNENGIQIEPEQTMLKNGYFPGWLGAKQGQHSGVEDCLTRYDCASAYESTIGSVRYMLPNGTSEAPGMFLCSESEGTGVNKPSRTPEPRYGDAELGKCKDQLCLNDLYH